jgi:hypothetical protein
MEPYHNPRSRHVSMELAITARGAIQVEGKGEMRTFLLMPGNNSAHFVKGTKK